MPWSFGGDDFAVAADDPIFPEWFFSQVESTVDAIVGSAARYVDIGAITYQEMELIAQFTTTAARDAIESRMGTTDTLEDDNGRQCQALLAATVPMRVKSPDSGIYRLGVRFIYVEP